MINAIQFLEGKKRVCDTFKKADCEGCPFLYDEYPEKATCGFSYNELYWNHETIIEILEKWLAAHPTRTNEEKFVEVFGFNPGVLRLGADSWYDIWMHKEYKEPRHED